MDSLSAGTAAHAVEGPGQPLGLDVPRKSWGRRQVGADASARAGSPTSPSLLPPLTLPCSSAPFIRATVSNLKMTEDEANSVFKQKKFN